MTAAKPAGSTEPTPDEPTPDEPWRDAYGVYSHGALRGIAPSPDEAVAACEAAGIHTADHQASELVVIAVKVRAPAPEAA